MGNWNNLKVTLNRGIDESEGPNSLDRSGGLLTGINLDFGIKGVVRGRPGWIRATDQYNARTLSAGGSPSYSGSSSLASLPYTASQAAVPITIGNDSTERPAVITNGRIYVQDGSTWKDRLGFGSFKAVRYPRFASGLNPNPATSGGTTDTSQQTMGATYDFGISTYPAAGGGTGPLFFAGLNTDNAVDSATPSTLLAGGINSAQGSGARCGTVTALLTKDGNNNNLNLSLRTAGGVITESTLAADAVSLGYAGRPCICCDLDQTVFFVAYWTTTANIAKLLRVSTAGAILTTQTFGFGASATNKAIWVTNNAVANNRVVVAVTDGATVGVVTQVFNATTLANIGINVTIGTGAVTMGAGGGQVVVGAANANLCYVAWVLPPGGALPGGVHIAQRSMTAATSQEFACWGMNAPYTYASGVALCGAVIYIQHQPIRLASGQILLGLSTSKAWLGLQSNGTPAATWMVLDLRDLWIFNNGAGVATSVGAGITYAASGNLECPVCVARGPLDGSYPAWGPMSAILSTDSTSYRFPSVDFNDTFPVSLVDVTNHLGDHVLSLAGIDGTLTLNEILPLRPKAIPFKSSTIIAGNVPRAVSGGICYPVGFPWMDGPVLSCVGAAGTDSWSVIAVWVWVDEAGQVHRSAPSNNMIVLGTTTPAIVCSVTPPILAERPSGTLFTEIYISPINSTSNAAHYLATAAAFPSGIRIPFDSKFAGAGVTGATINANANVHNPVLYTDGGILSCQTPHADGGVAVVSNRCWLSDGKDVFASRLGDSQGNNEAPSWHIDDTLKVAIPGVAGRVVGLEVIQDKLLVLCERGLFFTGGSGPDDSGVGPDFLEAQQLSSVGSFVMRGSTSFPDGVLFEDRNTLANSQQDTGGLWHVGSNFDVTHISGPIRNEFSTTPSALDELCYVPSRELIIWGSAGSLAYTFDLRAKSWSRWISNDIMASFTSARGLLWGLGNGNPVASLTGFIGIDHFTADVGHLMVVEVGNIPVSGDPGAYGRCRSVQLLMDPNSVGTTGNFDLEVAITESGTAAGAPSLGDVLLTAQSNGVTPIEAFLSTRQKCAYLDVYMQSSPGSAPFGSPAYVGLNLLVKGSARDKRGVRKS